MLRLKRQHGTRYLLFDTLIVIIPVRVTTLHSVSEMLQMIEIKRVSFSHLISTLSVVIVLMGRA